MKRIVCIGNNIVSPLGMTASENFSKVLAGESGVRIHENPFGFQGNVPASLFDREKIVLIASEEHILGLTFFEIIMVLSATRAIAQAGIDPSSERTAFIFSSIKGNVDCLPKEKDVPLAVSAARVLRHFGNPGKPFVVSNACISGLAAIIQARRRLESGEFDNAVVIGAEVQSKFIISGFTSLKALSSEPCRPFDRYRCGLNPGEAAATMVFTASDAPGWEIAEGAIRNDANHISGPSRTAEGCYNALRAVLGSGRPDFVGVHGTATPYNDEMESIALSRAGLQDVPVMALKSYYGHTMGAAGVLETILAMKAADAGILPGIKGFSECGVSNPLNLSAENRPVGGKCFVKLLSGFGGCNAAALFRK